MTTITVESYILLHNEPPGYFIGRIPEKLWHKSLHFMLSKINIGFPQDAPLVLDNVLNIMILFVKLVVWLNLLVGIVMF